MRFTLTACLLLSALSARRPHETAYGGELVRELGLNSGTVYPLLQRFTVEGVVEVVHETGDPREMGRPLRIYYSLTPEGRRLAAEAHSRLEQIVGPRTAADR